MKRILSFLGCLLLIGCLFGCKEKAPAAEENCTKYSLSSITMGNIVMSGKEAREQSGVKDLYIKFYENGTAQMRVEKEAIQMAYDDNYIWRIDTPEDKVPYSIEGNTVTVTDGAFVFAFQK